MFVDIINTIISDNDSFRKDFVEYHFAELIKEKLQSSVLRKFFFWDARKKEFFLSAGARNPMTVNEFQDAVSGFLNEEEFDKFFNNNIEGNTLEPISSVQLVEFVQYLSLVNGMSSNQMPWNLLLCVLYPELHEDKEKVSECISNAASVLADETIRISMIRERLKASIQQLNLIGTGRIATDILGDFFLDNYPQLFGKTSSDLIASGFEISAKEYIDSTDYTNIESDAGQVVVGQKVVGTDETVKYDIDTDGIVTSSVVSSDVYEDILEDKVNGLKRNESKVLGEWH